MTEQPFEACIIRLFTMDKNGIAGTGFLVSEKYAITCAHVVEKALGIPENSLDKPDGKLSLGVPHHRLQIEAVVEIWHPVLPNLTEDYSDIAILKLSNKLPSDIQPIVIKEKFLRWHQFRTYGYPAGFDKGSLAQGKIVGNPLGDRVEVECEQDKCIGHGFSGAPIWDETLQGIVGMVVEADAYESSKKAFFIPITTLIKSWPKLDQYCCRSQKQLPPKPESIPSLRPYLPDRDEQIWALRKGIRIHANKYPNKHRPLLCLIHGDEYQCLGRLVERFVSESLPKIIPEQMANTDVRAKYLPLPNSIDEFHEKILVGLGDLFGIPNDEIAQTINNGQDEIAQTIANAQYMSPVILYSEIRP